MRKELREVEFIVMLGPEDRYRETHVRFKSKIVSFVVQYETLVADKWLPVVRYDTAHGYSHRDLYRRKEGATKTPLFIADYNDALTFAESDLKANWRAYKERFLKGG